MVAATGALLMVMGGGAAGVAALTRDRPEAPRYVTALGDSAAGESAGGASAGGEAAGSGAARSDSAGGQSAGGAAAGSGAAGSDSARGGAAGSDSAGGDSAGGGAVAAAQKTAARPAAKAQIGVDAARLRTAAEAGRTATRHPISKPAPAATVRPPHPQANYPAAVPPAPPVITTRVETQVQAIPFSTRTVRDRTLRLGTQRVQNPGAAGERTQRYLVTLTGGRPTGRRLLDSTVTRQPAAEVVAVGARRDDQQSDGEQQSDGWQQSGGWHHRDRCRLTLDFCGSFSRTVTCSEGDVQWLEGIGAVPAGEARTVGNSEDALSPGAC